MNKFGTLLVSLSCFAGVVSAQNAPAPAPAAPAPAPAPAAPSAAQLELARSAIKAIGADRQIEGMSNQLKQMAADQASTLAPAGATDAQKAAVVKMQASIDELVADSRKNMTATLESGFATVYTAAELTAINTFFSSPEGQAFKTKQSQLSMQVGPQMQQITEGLRQKIGAIMQKAQQEATPAPAATPAAPAATATTPPIEVPPAPAK